VPSSVLIDMIPAAALVVAVPLLAVGFGWLDWWIVRRLPEVPPADAMLALMRRTTRTPDRRGTVTPDQAELFTLAAERARASGELPQAIQHLRSARALVPTDAERLVRLAATELEAGDRAAFAASVQEWRALCSELVPADRTEADRLLRSLPEA
jgi:hypothetical protein